MYDPAMHLSDAWLSLAVASLACSQCGGIGSVPTNAGRDAHGIGQPDIDAPVSVDLCLSTGCCAAMDGGASSGFLCMNKASADFGKTEVGKSPPLSVQFLVGNAGTVDSGKISVQVTGPGFTLDSTTCTELGPGATCQVNVTFLAVQACSASGTLLVVADSAGSTTANLSGYGIPEGPPSFFSPGSADFGDVALGFESTARFYFSLEGCDATTDYGYSISGSSDFVIDSASTTCTGTLPPRSACVVGVLFRPSVAGPATATLLAHYYQLQGVAPLSGNGVAR
jgi:hypothetical protein